MYPVPLTQLFAMTESITPRSHVIRCGHHCWAHLAAAGSAHCSPVTKQLLLERRTRWECLVPMEVRGAVHQLLAQERDVPRAREDRMHVHISPCTLRLDLRVRKPHAREHHSKCWLASLVRCQRAPLGGYRCLVRCESGPLWDRRREWRSSVFTCNCFNMRTRPKVRQCNKPDIARVGPKGV